MLHKDPDQRSKKTGRYAKMLLERFMKEQPKNSYEKVFGSSSTVIAAAQIANYHGAHIDNIASLLHNPGSTQQRLTRIGGPHGGGGLGQPEPILYGYRHENDDNINNNYNNNDDQNFNNNNENNENMGSNEEEGEGNYYYSSDDGGVEGGSRGKKISPGSSSNNVNSKDSPSTRQRKASRLPSVPILSKRGRSRSPPQEILSASSRQQKQPQSNLKVTTTVIPEEGDEGATSSFNLHQKSITATTTGFGGGGTTSSSKKHITIIQTPLEKRENFINGNNSNNKHNNNNISNSNNQTTQKSLGMEGRRFFSSENKDKAGGAGSIANKPSNKMKNNIMSMIISDEDVLSILVSSALHLNPVVDDHNLKSPDQSPTSSPLHNNNNNNNNNNNIDELDDDEAASSVSSGFHNLKNNKKNNFAGGGVHASDRINPQVQTYFRELGEMFSFNTNYTTISVPDKSFHPVAAAASSINNNNNNGQENNTALLGLSKRELLLQQQNLPILGSPMKLHLLPPQHLQQQVMDFSLMVDNNINNHHHDHEISGNPTSGTANNHTDDILFASMVPQRGSRRNSFTDFANNKNLNNNSNNNKNLGSIPSMVNSPAREGSGTNNNLASPAPNHPTTSPLMNNAHFAALSPQSPLSALSVALEGLHLQNNNNHKTNIRLPVDLCIQSIEAVFPHLRISASVQQALVCDEMVEDYYFNSDAANDDDDEPEANRGTISMREAEDLLFTSDDASLDLFLFLGAYDPTAVVAPLAMPENVDGLDTTIKLRQRLEILNSRFDGLYQKVQDMMLQQRRTDAAVEVRALGVFQTEKMKMLLKKGGKGAEEALAALSLAQRGSGGGDAGSQQQQQQGSPSGGFTSNTNNKPLSASEAAAARDDPASQFTAQQLDLAKTEEETAGPVPYTTKASNAINCFGVQQLVLPVTRLAEFEIIPWCIMDIYISVLFPTWADLGFVSMYSKSPPILDFEEFSTLMAVHRLVLHRRGEQVKAIRRAPIPPQPFTPWMPIVQRRMLRQTILVTQLAKKGRMIGGLNRGTSSVGGTGGTFAGSSVLGQSVLGASSNNLGASSGQLLGRDRTSSLYSSVNATTATAVATQKAQHGNIARAESSVHSSSNKDSKSLSGALQTSGGPQSKSINTNHPNNTPPRSGAVSSAQTPSVYNNYLTLPQDDAHHQQQQQQSNHGGGAGVDDDGYDAELMEDDDETRMAIEKSSQMWHQAGTTHFNARPLFDPPLHLVGVASKWPEQEGPTSALAKWQDKLDQVKSRHSHTEANDPDRPLSYRKLPLYDEFEDPVYEGPPKITPEYARRLELAGPPTFSVRKIDRSIGDNIPRFDKNLRPTSAKHWMSRDPVDGGSVVDRGGLRPVKPLTTLRSGMYWFCASREEPKKTADELELERLKQQFPEEFERQRREMMMALRRQRQQFADEERLSQVKSKKARKRLLKKMMKRKEGGGADELGIQQHYELSDDDDDDEEGEEGEEGGDEDDDDDDEIPEVESNDSSTDPLFGLYHGTKSKETAKREIERQRKREHAEKEIQLQYLAYKPSRPQTAPRKPWCGVAKSHLICHPPPSSNSGYCPDTRPATAQFQQRELDFQRGRRPADDPFEDEQISDKKNQIHNDDDEHGDKEIIRQDSSSSPNINKSANRPKTATKKPLIIRHYSEITSAVLRDATSNVRYHPDISQAGKNSRPTSAIISNRNATSVTSSTTRPTSAFYLHNNNPKTPSSTLSRPQTANNQQQHQRYYSYTGFHEDLYPSSNAPMSKRNSPIPNHPSSYTTTTTSATTQQNNRNNMNQAVVMTPTPPPLVPYQLQQQQQNQKTDRSTILSGTPAYSLISARNNNSNNNISPQHHQQQYRMQNYVTHHSVPSPLRELQERYGSEVNIPDLTQDQTSSFHRLLREAKKEAEARIAQTKVEEATQRQIEQQNEIERLKHVSPDRNRKPLKNGETEKNRSPSPPQAKNLINNTNNNNKNQNFIQPQPQMPQQPVQVNHNKKQEQTVHEAQNFHLEVMSWYKQGFGRSYMSSPPHNNNHSSGLAASTNMRITNPVANRSGNNNNRKRSPIQ